jgi:hypothetical protein
MDKCGSVLIILSIMSMSKDILFSLIKISHAFLISSKLSIRSDFLMIHNVITLIFCGENYQLFAPFDPSF